MNPSYECCTYAARLLDKLPASLAIQVKVQPGRVVASCEWQHILESAAVARLGL